MGIKMKIKSELRDTLTQSWERDDDNFQYLLN